MRTEQPAIARERHARRSARWLLCLLLLGAASELSATAPQEAAYVPVRELLDPDPAKRRKAAKKLLRSPEPRLLPALVDALFFTPREQRAEIVDVLRTLSGYSGGDRYQDWVAWLGAREEIAPLEGYRPFKAALFSRIDPRYAEILAGEGAALIRLEEIVWGGVRVEGIPALDAPAKVAAASMHHLGGSDLVLGVSLGGAHHAYPVKVLSWHEMVNDEVGGEPITLSFCTLCGSAVLFSTARADGEKPLTFGSSGLLYRSNKLMIDRAEGSLWINLTGEAVLGPAASAGARLELLPVTVTRWDAWTRDHPDTTVTVIDPLLAQRHGFLYEEGAADRAREGVSFPVWLEDDRLPPKAEVLALRVGGAPKAYALDALREAGVLNDAVGDAQVVIVVDLDGAARAYERGDRELAQGPEPGVLLDQAGGRWRIAEDALRPLDDGPAPLERLPSHLAFWFGWYGIEPDTELWPDSAAR